MSKDLQHGANARRTGGLRRCFARLLEKSSGALAGLARFVRATPGRQSVEACDRKQPTDFLPRRPVGNPSFRTRVFRASAAATLAFTVVTGAVLFYYAYEEAAEHQDDTLEEVSGVLARFVISGNGAKAAKWPLDAAFVFSMDDDDLEDVYEIERNDPASRIPAGTPVLVHTLHHGGAGVPVVFRVDIRPGLQTLPIDGVDYRMHVRTLRGGTHIAVAQRTNELLENAAIAALWVVLPIVTSGVVIALLTGLLFYRLLLPVEAAARTLNARRADDLSPLVTEGLPAEVLPMARSFNGLLARVTELREREARFVADAAHELRTPLAALLLRIERLAESETIRTLSPETRAEVDRLTAATERLVRMVNQLLALKRAEVEAAQSRQAPQATNTSNTSTASAASNDSGSAQSLRAPLDETVGPVVEALWDEVEKKRIDLEVTGLDDLEIDGRFPAAAMPADALHGMLRNLLENAVRYTPEGGRITIDLALGNDANPNDDTHALLRVSDTGPGIPEAERSRVFDPFYRVLGTGVDGTGLGLAIVKTIAGKYGVKVTLSDAAVSTGSTDGTDKAADGAASSPVRSGPGLCVTLLLPLASNPTESA
ncbi:sensor histidine kinase [Sutterella megalosphaeroides]|uniref:histidine kinase n=1 Tax=Sutterella megalosphaeroides TaxID=2494234 RepID=A0A2Z6IAG1_9BURK|nr:HAMP domain-containing sensor histidine kinase [Sutterella megalosphaeroides]BBF23409.1 hypothetical protein SUTMEG_13000 [Sutterella megalosphaeroides]